MTTFRADNLYVTIAPDTQYATVYLRAFAGRDDIENDTPVASVVRRRVIDRTSPVYRLIDRHTGVEYTGNMMHRLLRVYMQAFIVR